MIDESCKVPSENLDDGFNPCRKQVVENGELCQYAHMYDVMSERYDREEDISALEAEIEGKLDKVTSPFVVDRLYGVAPNGTQFMKNISSESRNIVSGHIDLQTAGSIADYVPIPLPVSKGGTGAQTRSLKAAAGPTLLPVIDSIGASGALNGYTSVTNIATFITTNNIRPEITAAFENHTADAVAHNDLLPTNALMMDYVDGSLINYNSITVSGGGTSNLVYNKVRLKNNRIYGDCDFTVDSAGGDGGVEVNIKITGTDINIPSDFTKFILFNKPILVHKRNNTIIEGKNIYNIINGTVYIQFNIGDFNTSEFIFIVDSVFTGYNQPV